MFRTLGSSALIGFLLIVPFTIMELVNRREFNEDFPFMLFLVLWINGFAISLILLPVIRGWRIGSRDLSGPIPTQRSTLLTTPKSAAMISVGIVLVSMLMPWLDSLLGGPLQYLVNGPNPAEPYLPGFLISLVFFSFPVVAGTIAGGPILSTLRAGGSLFVHPINLLIVVAISVLLGAGVVSLIVDQWPCFIGVPICD